MMARFSSIHTHNLIAFIAVLGAIVILALAGKATDLAIMTGLVGVLGSFKPWGSMPPSDGPKGTKEDPLAIEGSNNDKKPVHTTEGDL